MLTKALRSLSAQSSFLKTASLTTPKAFAFGDWKPNAPKYELRYNEGSYDMPHPVWDMKSAENVEITHYEPKDFGDKIALFQAKWTRGFFDLVSGYKPGQADENGYLERLVRTESLSGVPGMVGGMIRHLKSLSRMNPDLGVIHHLLEEAENERKHLFALLELKKPSLLFRIGLLASQTYFIFWYMVVYALSPKIAHRFVGYLREGSTQVYTHAINDIDSGKFPNWKDMAAPQAAIEYWSLPADAKFRDMLVAMRADEVMHREINHYFAGLKPGERLPGMTNLVSGTFKNNKFQAAPKDSQ